MTGDPITVSFSVSSSTGSTSLVIPTYEGEFLSLTMVVLAAPVPNSWAYWPSPSWMTVWSTRT